MARGWPKGRSQTAESNAKRKATLRIFHGPPRIKDHHTERSIWRAMKARCNDPKSISYKYYGAKGIKVCDRWANSFEAFLEDVGPRPSSIHSLDRFPDRTGDYKPDNIRWATRTIQNRNRSATKTMEFRGQVKPIAEWAEEFGLRPGLVGKRISYSGWTPEQALTTPPTLGGKVKWRRLSSLSSLA